jgi:hypothetical protein
MATLSPIRRMLLYSILFGALACAGPSSAARVAVPSAPVVAVRAPLIGYGRGAAEALLQSLHRGRFCRWHGDHRLCFKFVKLLRFCDRRPRHRLCDDDDDDRFCKKRPDHPLCDDDRFCKKRPDHPLCDDDDPPSPS